MQDDSFVKTKLYIPPGRADWVPRPELMKRLDAGLQRKLTVLSAPAGFGKTSLLSAWIQDLIQNEGLRPRTRFTWLSLDEGDNDAARFLAYLNRALQSILSTGDVGDLADFSSARQQPLAHQPILNRLINSVDEWLRKAPEGSRVVLVLDDYHTITDGPVHQSLVYLLDHLPPGMSLVIASRADPPLSLARFRARGEIIELRAADLRFSSDETRRLLNQSLGFHLTEKDLTALADRTEGWIAGLQMAALAMQNLVGNGTSLPWYSTFIEQLSGSNRYIMDYLLEEVLQHQSETVQDFLLKTSILERMCAPCCDSILGIVKPCVNEFSSSATPANSFTQGSHALLEYLDRANLFLVPLDDRREWYRYHRLFAGLLRKRLNLTSPGLIPELHRRASAWFERNGYLEEAIEHAFETKDEERAAGLVAKAAEGFMARSEFVTLRRWLDRVPEEQIATRPNLCVFHAWTLFLSNAPLKKVEARLALIQAGDEGQSGMAAALQAYIAVFKGLIPQAAAYARQALAGLPEEETFLRSMAFVVLASCELSEGDPESGYRSLEQAARLGERTGNVLASVIALVGIAEDYRKQGQLHQAETLYRQALDLSVDSKGKRLPIAGRTLCGLGDLLREWNRLEAAGGYLEEGIELLESWGTLAVYSGYIALARLKRAQNDLPGALEVIQKVQRLAAETSATPIDDWIVEMAQATLWIAHGDLGLAEAWAERRGLLQEPDPNRLKDSEIFAYAHLRKYELIVLARLRLTQGQAGAALQLLDSLLPEVTKMSRLGLKIEIQLLRALSLVSVGRQVEAFLALEAALSLAEPAGYVRLFLDEGDPVYRLLSEAGRRNPASGYIAGLLAAFEQERAPDERQEAGSEAPLALREEIVSLSERELEVLSLLRSRLTVPEMAEELCVAESTLRSHVKSIYSKLGVHRRMDAVQQAEELGLVARTPSRMRS